MYDLVIRTQNHRFHVDVVRGGAEERLYRIPGYFNRQGSRHWSWPATPAVAGSMVEHLAGLSVDFDPLWMELYEQHVKEQAALVYRTATGLEAPRSLTESWEHQKQAYHFLSRLSAGGLFADMGTGKTKVALDLIVNQGHKLVLVVCPKKAAGQWVKQAPIHQGDNVKVIDLSTGPLKERIERLVDYGTPVIYAINYEALVYESIQKALLDTKWDLVILDEAHRIKSPSGKTSRFVHQLGKQVPRRLAMTGTPAADKPLDVFGIYRFLDPGIFGLSFNRFREEYAITVNRKDRVGNTFVEIIGYQNQEELAERMYSIAFRPPADVVKLPEQHFVPWPVKLEPKTRKLYEQMRKESVIEIGESASISRNVITRLLRLQEITSGYQTLVDDDNNETLVEIGTEKQDALQEILEDIGPEPVVVFHRFTHDRQSIANACIKAGRDILYINGQRNDLDVWLDRYPDAVLCVQVAAGGEGIELQKASKVVYFSTDFSLVHWQQSLKRTHRPGQTKPVTYWLLQAEDSIDEYIYTALLNKEDATSYVVDKLRHGGRA